MRPTARSCALLRAAEVDAAEPEAGTPVSIPVPGQPGAAVGGRQWGQGPVALVFLHANGFCASTYGPLLAPLARRLPGRSVVGLDLRGHGRTTLPADPMRQDSWVRHRDDIAEALRGLPGGAAPEGLVLAGHSMGATTALLAAGAGLVAGLRRLVLFDPVFAPRLFYLYARAPWAFRLWRTRLPIAAAALRRRPVFDSRAAALTSWRGRGVFRSWAPGFLEGYVADGLADSPDGTVRLSCDPQFEASCYGGQRHDPHGALRAAGVPVAILKAERGATCRAPGLARLAPPGFAQETIAGSSHFLPMEQPDLCRERLLQALHPTG